jgi:hypothetical protein
MKVEGSNLFRISKLAFSVMVVPFYGTHRRLHLSGGSIYSYGDMARLVFRNFCVIGLMLLGGASATAQTTLPDIEQTLRQLSSDNWGTRQSAQQTLVQMGDSAEPALRDALKKSLDPETQSRIEEAIREIDANRLTGPSIVTLDYDAAELKTVLDDLGRQAHAQIVLPNVNWGGVPKSVTIHVHRQPFWVAMTELCQKTGLCPQFDSSDHKMTLVQGNDFLNGIVQYQGPFLVVARRIIQNAELSLATGQTERRSTSLEMAILAEPKLTVVGHAYMPHIDTAIDDAGNSLTPRRNAFRFNPVMFNAMNVDDSRLWMANITLECPDDHSKKIAKLKGSFRTAIETRSEAWTIPNILKAQTPTRTFGSSTFSVESITQTQNQYMVRISGTRLATTTDDAFLGLGQIDLLDAHDKPLTRRPMGGGGGMNRMMYTFSFDSNDPANPAGEPTKLVWNVPVGTKVIDIPFEFKNLPLP